MSIEPSTLRKVLGAYPTGVAFVTGFCDGRPVGLVANSLTSVSLSPPLLSLCVATSSSTWFLLQRSRSLAVNILSENQESIAQAHDATQEKRFESVTYHTGRLGAPIVDGSVASFECRLHDTMDAGDHHIALLQIETIHQSDPVPPALLFHKGRFLTTSKVQTQIATPERAS